MQQARWRSSALCRELFHLWEIMTRTQRAVQAACQLKAGGGHATQNLRSAALVEVMFVRWRAQGLQSVRSRCAAEAQIMKRVCVYVWKSDFSPLTVFRLILIFNLIFRFSVLLF